MQNPFKQEVGNFPRYLITQSFTSLNTLDVLKFFGGLECKAIPTYMSIFSTLHLLSPQRLCLLQATVMISVSLVLW